MISLHFARRNSVGKFPNRNSRLSRFISFYFYLYYREVASSSFVYPHWFHIILRGKICHLIFLMVIVTSLESLLLLIYFWNFVVMTVLDVSVRLDRSIVKVRISLWRRFGIRLLWTSMTLWKSLRAFILISILPIFSSTWKRMLLLILFLSCIWFTRVCLMITQVFLNF